MLYFGSYYGAIGLSYGYVVSFAVFEIYLWIKFRKALNVKIDADGLLWLLAIGFFLVSYFIPVDLGFMYRLLVGGIALGGLALFL